MDLADFKEEHSTNRTSDKSLREHSPKVKAAKEGKCWPNKWEL